MYIWRLFLSVIGYYLSVGTYLSFWLGALKNEAKMTSECVSISPGVVYVVDQGRCTCIRNNQIISTFITLSLRR